MVTSEAWQLASEAARRYEEILVPTILGPAAGALVEALRIVEGDRVLDVGCGTGAAARLAARRVGASGAVTGVDVNAGMLECARASLAKDETRVTLREGSALDLPFPDGSFDVVLCAQTLQFLPERARAVSEMRRVVRPGGGLGVSTWAPLERHPYFHGLVEAVIRHVGRDTAVGLGAAFGLSDADELRGLLSSAGADEVDVREVELELRLPDLESFVPRHISATPMAEGYARSTERARAAVVDDVRERMAAYVTPTGASVPFRPLIATAVG